MFDGNTYSEETFKQNLENNIIPSYVNGLITADTNLLKRLNKKAEPTPRRVGNAVTARIRPLGRDRNRHSRMGSRCSLPLPYALGK